MIDYLSHHGVKGMRWGVRKDKDKTHRQGAMAGYVKVAQRIQDVEKVVDTKSSKAVKLKAESTLYRTHRGKEGKKLGDHSYFSTNNVDAAQFLKNHFNDTYINEVKNRGYNALQDFNDAKGVSKSPIVALDPDGSVREVGRKALSAWDINESQKNLKAFR